MGVVTDFVLERTCPEESLNLSKLGFISEEGHSDYKFQNIAIRPLKGNVLCQIWLNGPIKRILSQKLTSVQKVNERALRFVSNQNKGPTLKLLNKIALPSLENQRLAKIVCTVFNVINNGHAPKSKKELIGFRNNKYNLRGSDISKRQRPALQLTALNRGGLRHQNSGTHYLTQAEQLELSRLLKTVLEH